MPTMVLDLPALLEPCHKRWTRSEYEKLFAGGAIVEYWVLDIACRRMIVDRSPQLGSNARVGGYAPEENAELPAGPEAHLVSGRCVYRVNSCALSSHL
jgi:hypothetical protein